MVVVPGLRTRRDKEMAKSQHASLDAMLFGFQLMSFEILWDAFPWMESIWIREESAQLQLFVQTTEWQDEKEWDDLNYLLREMFDVKEKVLDETGDRSITGSTTVVQPSCSRCGRSAARTGPPSRLTPNTPGLLQRTQSARLSGAIG